MTLEQPFDDLILDSVQCQFQYHTILRLLIIIKEMSASIERIFYLIARENYFLPIEKIENIVNNCLIKILTRH